MLARVRRTIRERGLLTPGERVLVACSGGPDSAALLHVLFRLGDLDLDLHVASVNHGLRPDAEDDVRVAGEHAASLGVPFTSLAVQVQGDGASVQEHARIARYAALGACALRVGASSIAVGHTLDDQAETVLSRLLRGASIAGLSGIDPDRPDGVVRPLIDCRRAEVRAHVQRFELPHVEDPSNRDARYERVRLREAILPALAAEDPNIAIHLAHLADEARELGTWVERRALELLASREEPNELVLAGPPPVRTHALRRWIEELTGRPAKRAHLDSLRRGDETLLAGDIVARREGDRVEAKKAPDRATRSRPAGPDPEE